MIAAQIDMHQAGDKIVVLGVLIVFHSLDKR